MKTIFILFPIHKSKSIQQYEDDLLIFFQFLFRISTNVFLSPWFSETRERKKNHRNFQNFRKKLFLRKENPRNETISWIYNSTKFEFVVNRGTKLWHDVIHGVARLLNFGRSCVDYPSNHRWLTFPLARAWLHNYPSFPRVTYLEEFH